MRTLFLTAIFLVSKVYAQTEAFDIHIIQLPKAIAYYDNQFSGLQVANEKLYLLSECRIQDKRETVIYSISLKELEQSFLDTSHQLQYEKTIINGLEALAAKMQQNNQEYEGLEAFVIKNNTVYLSVETNTPSPLAYILKGKLKHNTVQLSKNYLAVAKPHKPDGTHIYNAAFESMMLHQNKLALFFEYNYFEKNYAYTANTALNNHLDSIPLQHLPFRITDITQIDNDRFMALNVFYKGDGGDTVYRVPDQDSTNNNLIKFNGAYEDYSRLIELKYNDAGFTWKPVWEFPIAYRGYNWEGIAKYKNGYFVINDKYTRNKPYMSTLLYLQPSK